MGAKKDLEAQKKFFRLANYLGTAQLYLKDNFTLSEPLKREHIKERILGHWGTVPGLNFIYMHLGMLAQKHKQETLMVTGPGHGYPALLSNLYIEGTLGEYYPQYKQGLEGMGNMIRDFSWPGGFPSHANPETPGVILEGGELGYALSTSFGAVFDHPDLLVGCVVGDGEAETGPLAASWQSNKFLNPVTDGAVLPIVHINKYKISGPTILGSMSRRELENYFIGLGYEPIIVHATEEGVDPFESMQTSMEFAYLKIKEIQHRARIDGVIQTPRWPVVLFISKKGWTMNERFNGRMMEDSFRSHGIPFTKVHKDDQEFEALKEWLESYNVSELIKKDGTPIDEIMELIPDDEYKIGKVKYANGGDIRKPLKLPMMEGHEHKVENPADSTESNTGKLGEYLRDVISLNKENFRVMCPDETESNNLKALFEVTDRCYMWPVPEGSENISQDGRVMEILSEHTLQGWLEGYLLTGGHGIFITYEAFAVIVASMVDQYNKFLKQSKAIKWRKPISSMNFVLTSTSWRQDHNGFSHQNPGFISAVLNNNSGNVHVYFPLDANMMVAALDESLSSTNTINVIVAGKRPLPQYMTLEEAKDALHAGMTRLPWAGNNDEDADVVLAATGDYAAQETFAALQILRDIAPEMKTRCVYVSELTCFHIGGSDNSYCLNVPAFREVMTEDRDIIYSYHGYSEDIRMLLFGHPDADRFTIHGYREKGTTTTPFDMLVQNRNSRYHLALEAIKCAAKHNKEIAKKEQTLKEDIQDIFDKHKAYITQYGADLPEVRDFKFKF